MSRPVWLLSFRHLQNGDRKHSHCVHTHTPDRSQLVPLIPPISIPDFGQEKVTKSAGTLPQKMSRVNVSRWWFTTSEVCHRGRRVEWARLGSNQGPAVYKTAALPLSYAPNTPNSIAIKEFMLPFRKFAFTQVEENSREINRKSFRVREDCCGKKQRVWRIFQWHSILDRAYTLADKYLEHIGTTPLKASNLPLSVKQNLSATYT